MATEASPRPDLVEQLRAQPGGASLLELEWPEPVFLVGGAVRDMLLGATPRELDVVVEGDAHGFALKLAKTAGAGHAEVLHDRFETATLRLGAGQTDRCQGVRVDVARSRTECYPAPGALPEVTPAALVEDLSRRDFTVNAIALALGPGESGELVALAGALEDLRAGRLRVLHERSFSDDPTRLLRLARYEVRLGFAADPATDALAALALGEGALSHVSGSRLGSELRLALAEPDPSATLERFARRGILEGLNRRLRWDGELFARASALLFSGEEAERTGGVSEPRSDLLALAAIVLPLTLRADVDERGAEARALLERLEFLAVERDRVLKAALATPRLVEELEHAASPAKLRASVDAVPIEGVALAGAMCDPQGPGFAAARRWLSELRFVRLRIDGADLLAAGLPQGRDIGRRLEATLELRLEGRLPDDREAQLAAALELE